MHDIGDSVMVCLSLGFTRNTLQDKETNGSMRVVRSFKPVWKLLCIRVEWFDEHLAELLKLLRTPDFLCE